jgi:hypothetical protein
MKERKTDPMDDIIFSLKLWFLFAILTERKKERKNQHMQGGIFSLSLSFTHTHMYIHLTTYAGDVHSFTCCLHPLPLLPLLPSLSFLRNVSEGMHYQQSPGKQDISSIVVDIAHIHYHHTCPTNK